MSDDNSDRRFDSMSARTDAFQVSECGDDTDSPMPAHSQIRDMVEKDHAGYARLIDRRTQQRSDNRVGATRFIHHRATEIVIFISEASDPIGERVVAEIGTTVDDHTRWFTTRVRVDYFDASYHFFKLS
jgi:hypothetical protein